MVEKKNPIMMTSFRSARPFEGRIVINREGDLFPLYKELEGPNFSESELKRRDVKYKVFVGEGKVYVPDTLIIPKLLYGVEIPAQIEKEGNLIAKLNDKYEKFNKINEAHKDSFKELIQTSRDYISLLKNLDFRYRSAYKEILKNIDLDYKRREELKLINKKVREKFIAEKKIELHDKLNNYFESLEKQNEALSSQDKKSEEVMENYEIIIKNTHFLLQDMLIIGAGRYADIKSDEKWVSEHQGIIDFDEWRGIEGKKGSIVFRNLGLANATILRFFENGTLESTLNEAYQDNEIINLDKLEKQKTIVFLSPGDKEPPKEYEEFKTSPVYICFEVPKKV